MFHLVVNVSNYEGQKGCDSALLSLKARSVGMPLKDKYPQPVPDWLHNLDLGGTNPLNHIAVPLQDLLTRSLYYPASGLDGRPVQFLAGFIHSFIYADYGLTSEEVRAAFQMNGFRGYKLRACRAVAQTEIAPANWKPQVPPRFQNELRRLAALPEGILKPYFAEWMIFERLDEFGADHGPVRFSLLYICEEGVSLYQALYKLRNTAPLILTIIQPGTGFGGNFTDFRDPNGFLANTVLCTGSTAIPNYMVCGGLLLDYYNAFWEHHYPRLIEYFQHPYGNGIWGRRNVVP